MRRSVRTDVEQERRGQMGRRWLALRVTGVGLLVSTGGFHLDLYLTGYRSIRRWGGSSWFRR